MDSDAEDSFAVSDAGMESDDYIPTTTKKTAAAKKAPAASKTSAASKAKPKANGTTKKQPLAKRKSNEGVAPSDDPDASMSIIDIVEGADAAPKPTNGSKSASDTYQKVSQS